MSKADNKELEEAIDNLLMLKYFLNEEKEENYREYTKAIETVSNYIDNSISKNKIRKVIEKIETYENIAREQINERIIIADSDSLNFGRKQAHGKDIEVLKELLEENR